MNSKNGMTAKGLSRFSLIFFVSASCGVSVAAPVVVDVTAVGSSDSGTTSAIESTEPTAPNATLVSAQPPLAAATAAKSPVSMSADISTTSTLQREGDVSRSAENALSIGASYQLNPRFKLSTKALLTQEITGERATTLSNMKVSLGHKAFKLNENFSFSPSVSATLPTNTLGNKDDGFKGATGISGSLSVDPKHKSEITGRYGLSVDRNIHRYTHNDWGSANIQYRFVNSAGIAAPVSKTVSLSVDGAYIAGLTYRGFPRNSFSLSQTLSWDALPTWSVYLVHANGGAAFKPNGRDTNIKAFDDRSSSLTAGTALTF